MSLTIQTCDSWHSSYSTVKYIYIYLFEQCQLYNLVLFIVSYYIPVCIWNFKSLPISNNPKERIQYNFQHLIKWGINELTLLNSWTDERKAVLILLEINIPALHVMNECKEKKAKQNNAGDELLTTSVTCHRCASYLPRPQPYSIFLLYRALRVSQCLDIS